MRQQNGSRATPARDIHRKLCIKNIIIKDVSFSSSKDGYKVSMSGSALLEKLSRYNLKFIIY